ncbi:MAG: glycosyltransferase family 39 protein [Acidobacteriota bacterium]
MTSANESERWAFSRQHYGLAGIFFLAAAALWLATFSTDRFVDRDAYDYAQIGRQIERGEGFTTLQTFPRHISYMEQQGMLEGPWPSLLRYPVSPALNALAQTVITDPVTAATVQTGVCFLLSVPLLFLLAARVTNLLLASLATLLYVGDPRIWRDSANGMTESVALLILLAVLNLASLPAVQEGKRSTWVALGLLSGLAYLTRTQLIVLVPLGLAWILFTVRRPVRLRTAVFFLASALLAVSPWLIRNARVTGDPTFAFTNSRNLLAHTESYTGIDRYLHEPTDVAVVIDRYGHEILAKIGRHLWPNVVDPRFWFEAVGVYTLAIPLFLLGVALHRRYPLKRPAFLVFERTTLLLLLANFFLVCLIYHRQRYYDTMIPLLIIVLVQRLVWLMDGILPAARRWQQGVLLVLLALSVGRLGHTLNEHAAAPGVPEADRQTYARLDQLIADDRVVLSDLSGQVTLYNGNRTVRTPANPREILEIDADYLTIDYVLISQRFMRPAYEVFLASPEFLERFEPSASLPNGALLFRKVAVVSGL